MWFSDEQPPGRVIFSLWFPSDGFGYWAHFVDICLSRQFLHALVHFKAVNVM
jgi:hypothetical protein